MGELHFHSPNTSISGNKWRTTNFTFFRLNYKRSKGKNSAYLLPHTKTTFIASGDVGSPLSHLILVLLATMWRSFRRHSSNLLPVLLATKWRYFGRQSSHLLPVLLATKWRCFGRQSSHLLPVLLATKWRSIWRQSSHLLPGLLATKWRCFRSQSSHLLPVLLATYETSSCLQSTGRYNVEDRDLHSQGFELRQDYTHGTDACAVVTLGSYALCPAYETGLANNHPF
jgi:hypothetical protein